MRVMVIGATGTIGRSVVRALVGTHDVVAVSHHEGEERVDIDDPRSIQSLYQRVGAVDAVVCAAGRSAFKPFMELEDADYELGLRSKLMGQVNVVRYGLGTVRHGGSFTLTAGILARHPSPGSAATSLVNAALEGFVRAAALELPHGMRINAVSPPWVSETLAAMGQDPSAGSPAAEVAKAYVAAVDGSGTGRVIGVPAG